MKSIRRRVHDLYADLRSAVGLYPQIESSPLSLDNVEGIPLVESGSAEISCELEARFHNRSRTFSICRWPSVNLYRIKHASIVGDQANIFLPNGKWLRVCPSHEELPIKKVRHPITIGADRLKTPIFHLSGKDHENHGHFLLQHMPRWLAAVDLMRRMNLDFKIFVAKGHSKWQSRYLLKCGVRASQIIECSDGTTHCDDLFYVPQLRRQDACISRPQEYVAMRERFHRPCPKTGPALFLSRKDAPNRLLLNESEAVAQFEKTFGNIRVIELSKTPLDQQVSLISEAPVVISPLGQALTVSLFAKDSVFINLDAGVGPNPWGDAFRDVANICGNQALSLHSQTACTKDGSFIFPPEDLNQMLIKVKRLIQA